MSEDPIGAALRNLPRERAGADFTARVLARLDHPFRRRPRLALRLALGAAALAAAVALPLAFDHSRPASRPDRAARLEALLREQERLVAEVEALKLLSEGSAPVVYLGGDEETDLLLDLDRLARRRQSEIRPASLVRPERR
jgi:hypothetical protein